MSSDRSWNRRGPISFDLCYMWMSSRMNNLFTLKSDCSKKVEIKMVVDWVTFILPD